MIADFKHVFAHRVMNVNTRLAKHGNGNGQPNKVCSECSHEGEITKTNFEEEKTGSVICHAPTKIDIEKTEYCNKNIGKGSFSQSRDTPQRDIKTIRLRRPHYYSV